MKSLRNASDRLIALFMSPWRWLMPRARFYKATVWAIALLLVLVMTDQAFVLPEVEGWLGVVSLAIALVLGGWMAWRWSDDETLDVPFEWLSPVRSRR